MLHPLYVLGNYRILIRIGQGASAIVYKAEDLRLGRLVALKILHFNDRVPESERQEQTQRFHREALSAASLNHPNTVTIFDVGEWQGMHYIAMELLEGETLRERVSRQKILSPLEVWPILQPLCAALEYMHQRALIHRDIKPDNVFLLADGRVKLADFGIARRIEDAGLTQHGWLPGSPAYMSPEQIVGDPLDSRTDIFSLGIMLYELLAGYKPFKSESVPMAVHNILHSAPAPLAGLPAPVRQVVMQALEKEPGRRFQTMRAFASAYHAALAESGLTISAPEGNSAKQEIAAPPPTESSLSEPQAATARENALAAPMPDAAPAPGAQHSPAIGPVSLVSGMPASLSPEPALAAARTTRLPKQSRRSGGSSRRLRAQIADTARSLALLCWFLLLAFSLGLGLGALVEHYSAYRILPQLPVWRQERGGPERSAAFLSRSRFSTDRHRTRLGQRVGPRAAGNATPRDPAGFPMRGLSSLPVSPVWIYAAAGFILISGILLWSIQVRHPRRTRRHAARAGRLRSLQVSLLALIAIIGGLFTGMVLIENSRPLNPIRTVKQTGGRTGT